MDLEKRVKNYFKKATHAQMDEVDDRARTILAENSDYSRREADRKALRDYLNDNPDLFTQEGGNYKKHKTLKRKHRNINNKSKKYKRTRYHRKSKK
jgi:hypothetical protein